LEIRKVDRRAGLLQEAVSVARPLSGAPAATVVHEIDGRSPRELNLLHDIPLQHSIELKLTMHGKSQLLIKQCQ